MPTRTLARRRLSGAGWAHPYASPFVLYADGGDPSAGDPSTPPAQPAPVTPPVPQPPATPPTGQDPAAEIARLTKELEAARGEAAKSRVNAKEAAAQEAREELLRQLSGDAEQPLTPEQLQQQLAEARTQGTAAQEQALGAAIELSVYRTAQRLGADAERLLDSRSFLDQVDALDIDPTDRQAFEAAVTERVNAALAANPGLRAGPAIARSGGDMGGGGSSGDGALTIDAQIDAARKAGRFTEVIALKRRRATQTTT
jgi:hypothetical protein